MLLQEKSGKNFLPFEAGRERLSELIQEIHPSVSSLLEKALSGGVLNFDEGLRLAEAQGKEMEALVLCADEVRRRDAGEVVTFVVNRNINFTNVCFVGCKFCAFSTGPNHDDAYFLNYEDIKRKTKEAWEMGATEVCVQGGLPKDMDKFHYRNILRAIKEAAPDIHIHAFSPMEVVYGVEITGMSLRDYLWMLKDNGLGTLPGTAAEILDDEVRRLISRQKLTAGDWVDVIKTAHSLGIRTTSTLMYGHVEEKRHWVNQLLLLRSIQEETGGFTEFVPLGFIHQNTDLYKQGLARAGATFEEHLKIHALARLMLRGAVNNIQVSWVKLGYEMSQACLQAGANDYGGTLMEENISRLAGATGGQYISPPEFQERIRELGRIPAERTTMYQIIKSRVAC